MGLHPGHPCRTRKRYSDKHLVIKGESVLGASEPRSEAIDQGLVLEPENGPILVRHVNEPEDPENFSSAVLGRPTVAAIP